MWSVFGCFTCADKVATGVIRPQMGSVEAIQQRDGQQNNCNSFDKIQDSQSFISKTTHTLATVDTLEGKCDQDEEIAIKVDSILGKSIAQRKVIEAEFVKQNLTRKTTIFLIDKRWSQKYTHFLKSITLTQMPQINNYDLLDQRGQLKVGLREKQDYFVVSEKVWKFLNKIYGGGPAIQKNSFFPTIALTTKKVCLPPTGIENPLNQCFIICIIQMLMSIEQLNSYFLRKQSYFKSDFIQTHLETRKKLLEEYSGAGDQEIMRINQFSQAFSAKFDPQQQHDAHEFFLNFVEALQNEMKEKNSMLLDTLNNSDSNYSNYFTQHKSIVDKIFAGQHLTVITCLSCGNRSQSYSPFLEIVVPIQGMKTLKNCLNEYYKYQKLEDLYNCQSCKSKTRATKTGKIAKAPNYLLIVLAKFCPETLNKIENRIKYESSLDISPYCIGHCGDTTYQLNSIIVHKGSKSNKGHYYAMTKREKEWFYCNDNVTKQIEEKDAFGRDPYMLLFERV